MQLAKVFVAIALALVQTSWTVPLHVPVVSSSGGCLPFTDNFVHASGTYVTYSPWAQSPTTDIWIQSNTAQLDTSSASVNAFVSGCSGYTTSNYAQITVSGPTGAYVWAVVNTTSSSNGYYVVCDIGTTPCQAQNGSTGLGGFIYQIPASTSVTICAEVDSGTTLKLKANGSYDATTYSVSGASGGFGGFGLYDSTASAVTQFKTGNGTCP